MAKVTWLGEDDLHTGPDGTLSAGPSFTVWGGVKFPKGEAVELRNPAAVAKASGNPFFEVEDAEDVDEEAKPVTKPKRGRPPKVKTDGDENH